MVTEMYVRGLSTRDVQSMFIQTIGQQLLSRSSVSRITRRLQKDFDTWRKRDLSGLKVLYLFLDAVYLPLRQGVKEKKVYCVPTVSWKMERRCFCTWLWAVGNPTIPGSVFFMI
jgi:transposase-like protein